MCYGMTSLSVEHFAFGFYCQFSSTSLKAESSTERGRPHTLILSVFSEVLWLPEEKGLVSKNTIQKHFEYVFPLSEAFAYWRCR